MVGQPVRFITSDDRSVLVDLSERSIPSKSAMKVLSLAAFAVCCFMG
jgi:hypothetical protein